MKGRVLAVGVALLVCLALITMAGFFVQGTRSASSSISIESAKNVAPGSGTQDSGPMATPAAPSGAPSSPGYGVSGGNSAQGSTAGGVAPTDAGGSKGTQSTPAVEPMIVKNASVDLRVNDVAKTVAAIQLLATANNAQVQNLTYSRGISVVSPVEPLAASSSTAQDERPSSAQITLRVPADKLDNVTHAVANLGVLQSQTASQDDVTAQHADMAARLKNMRAEEARLRALYAKAGSVNDLLEVEARLSAVRGDIEAAQAQIRYLEQQVALSTLVVTLSQPGPIVRPSAGTSWGIGDAVTQGVQTAVAFVRAFITGIIALLPALVLVLVAWGAVVLVRRARKPRSDAGATSVAEADAPAVGEATSMNRHNDDPTDQT